MHKCRRHEYSDQSKELSSNSAAASVSPILSSRNQPTSGKRDVKKTRIDGADRISGGSVTGQ